MCIDYKIVNNIPKIFEINPRIGTSLIYKEPEFKKFMTLYIDNNF